MSRPLPYQPPPLTEALVENAQRIPDQDVVIFDDRVVTFRILEQESRSLAAGLQALGVAKGEPVAILIGNRSEFLIAFFGILRAGAVANPVTVSLKGESLKHIFTVSEARFAIAEAPFVERLVDAVGPDGLDRIFVVDGAPTGDRQDSYAALLAPADRYRPVDIARADPSTLMFTSGTTGVAKGVTLPHQQLATAAWDCVKDMKMDSETVFYLFNPMFHLNGLIFGPMASVQAGNGAKARARYVFPKEATLADLKEKGATHWTATPFLIRGMLAAPEQADDADNALRYVMTYGLTEAETAQFNKRFGCKLVGGYGSTEAGMVCGFQGERPTACGRISDRVDVRIVDPDGTDVAAGDVGEIWVRTRAPHDTMLGYWNMPKETAAAFADGWFRTGDTGRFDADGILYFADRLKESLKRRGENISTFEVEQALMSYPGITTAAVIGFRPAPDEEEEVRAFVEYAGQAPLDHAALVRHCGNNLAYFMLPRFIDRMTELPRTPVGKVAKHMLKDVPITATTFDVKTAGIKVER